MDQKMKQRRNRLVMSFVGVMIFSLTVSAVTFRNRSEFNGGVLGVDIQGVEFAYGSWTCKDGEDHFTNADCTPLTDSVVAASERCGGCTADGCGLDRLKLRFHCKDGVNPCDEVTDAGECIHNPSPSPTSEPTITPSATLTPTATPTTEPEATPTPSQPINLLTNGDFSNDGNSWAFHTKGKGNFTVVSGEAKVLVKETSGVIQFYQAGVELKSNTRYRVSFIGMSSNGNDGAIQIIMDDSPYSHLVVSDSVQFELDTSMSDVSVELTTTNFGSAEPNARFRFWLGGQAKNGETYTFDDVVMEEL